jgi:hypothetical protein
MSVLREIDRFLARSEDGKHEVEIVIRQMEVDVASRADPTGIGRGMKEARTAEGGRCDCVDEDTFLLKGPPHSGVIVKRVRS